MPPASAAWWQISSSCPSNCGGQLQVRTRRTDSSLFVGCSNYPRCKFTRNYTEPSKENLLANLAELTAERDELRQQLRAARGGGPGPDATPALVQELARELLRVAQEFHPDRNPGGLDAGKVTARILELRDGVKGKKR